MIFGTTRNGRLQMTLSILWQRTIAGHCWKCFLGGTGGPQKNVVLDPGESPWKNWSCWWSSILFLAPIWSSTGIFLETPVGWKCHVEQNQTAPWGNLGLCHPSVHEKPGGPPQRVAQEGFPAMSLNLGVLASEHWHFQAVRGQFLHLKNSDSKPAVPKFRVKWMEFNDNI